MLRKTQIKLKKHFKQTERQKYRRTNQRAPPCTLSLSSRRCLLHHCQEGAVITEILRLLGIILEVGEFSARIGVWDGEIEAVKPCNLSEYSFSPAQKAEVVRIRDRILQLQKAIAQAPRLETAALAVLANIAKKKEPYLSEIEEKLLLILEAEYLDGQN